MLKQTEVAPNLWSDNHRLQLLYYGFMIIGIIVTALNHPWLLDIICASFEVLLTVVEILRGTIRIFCDDLTAKSPVSTLFYYWIRWLQFSSDILERRSGVSKNGLVVPWRTLDTDVNAANDSQVHAISLSRRMPQHH